MATETAILAGGCFWGAQDLLRRDPDRAAAVLEAVAETGRRALSETGRLLHVLRDDDDELGLRPTPGLANLPELVAATAGQGLTVAADLPNPVPHLPAGVDVSMPWLSTTRAIPRSSRSRDSWIRCSRDRPSLSSLVTTS